MDEEEVRVKRTEMELYDDPADRPAFADRTDRDHTAALEAYGAVGQFRAALEEHVEGRVLDVCCGNARWADELLAADPDLEYVGLDLAVSGLRAASERLDDRSVMVRGDTEYLPFATDSFDTLVCSAALHHLPDWDGRGLDEICRVLRPDGRMVFREPLRYNPLAWAFRRFTPGPCHTPHESPFDPSVLRDELESRFGSVDLVGHYITALAFPVLDGVLPVDIPPSVTKRIYDLERRVIDNGGLLLATHTHGTAHHPRG